ncbi:hypothetical protein TI39_contig4401g00001, partial [Zymoseptoria brevis]
AVAARYLLATLSRATTRAGKNGGRGSRGTLSPSLGIPFLETSAKNANNVERASFTMARLTKGRMGNTTVNNKPTVQVGQASNVQFGSAGGICQAGILSNVIRSWLGWIGTAFARA